jgi:hypothetical protein
MPVAGFGAPALALSGRVATARVVRAAASGHAVAESRFLGPATRVASRECGAAGPRNDTSVFIRRVRAPLNDSGSHDSLPVHTESSHLVLLPSADKSIVLVMPADPEPQKITLLLHRKRPMVGTDARGPEAADLLEVERWMPRITLEQHKRSIGKLPHLRRKPVVRLPEPRTGSVLQSGRVRPARRSAMASSASASRRPAATSSSKSRSQAAASNSRNHRRNSESSFELNPLTARSISLMVDIP